MPSAAEIHSVAHKYTNDTLMYFLPQKTQMNTEIVRAGGSLIEEVAGNVVLQRFRLLQMNAT